MYFLYNRRIRIPALLIIVSLLLCGCSQDTAIQQTQEYPSISETTPVETQPVLFPDCTPIELSWACSASMEDTEYGEAVYRAIEMLEQWTDGNFKIRLFPNGSLGTDEELIHGLEAGLIDMFSGTPASQISIVPELQVLELYGVYPDLDLCNQVLSQDFLPFISPYYEDTNLILLGGFASEYRLLTSSRALEDYSSMAGLRIRVQPGAIHTLFWESLGMQPAFYDLNKLYTAIQQNAVDCQDNAYSVLQSQKLYKLQPYIYEIDQLPNITLFTMNRERYQSMTAAQKEALTAFLSYIQNYQLEHQTQQLENSRNILSQSNCRIFTEENLPASFSQELSRASEAVQTHVTLELGEDFVSSYLALVEKQRGLTP